MMQVEDILDYLIGRVTEIEGTEACQKAPEVRSMLHKTLEQAELMHCYLGFRKENRERAAQGLPPLAAEEEFSRHGAAMIHFFTKHDR